MSNHPDYPTRDAPYVTPATLKQAASVDTHDAPGMVRWLHERAEHTVKFLALTDDQQRTQFLVPWQRNVLPHLAFRFKQAAQLIERLDADAANERAERQSWQGVAHDHSERLKVVTAESERMREALRKLAGECAECGGTGSRLSGTECGIKEYACEECADVRQAIGEPS